MKKFLFLSFALFALLSCSTLKEALSSGGAFTFIQMSDTQLGFYEPYGTFVRTEKMLNHAIDECNEMKPAFVIVTGDMVDKEADEDQFNAYMKAISRLDKKIPIYMVPGNHDMEHFYSKEKFDRYIQRYGYEKFSFIYKNCAFIGFDSNCIRYDAAEEEALQYAWLRQQLTQAKNKGCRLIFTFCHVPVIYGAPDQPEDYSNFPLKYRQKYLDLFNEFGVAACFAGHTHHPLCTEYKGTYYCIAGATGTTFEGSPSGYHVVNVGKGANWDFKFTAIANQEQ